MRGASKIEYFIIKNFKKITLPVFTLILISYVINYKYHYKLFFNQLNKLENDINSYRYDYQITERFIIKIIKSTNFVGRDFLNLGTIKYSNCYRLALVNLDVNNKFVFDNIAKIIHRIKEEKPNIEILDFSFKRKGSKEYNINLQKLEKSLFENLILIIDSKNKILAAFPIDGMESSKELQLISRYLLEIILNK